MKLAEWTWDNGFGLVFVAKIGCIVGGGGVIQSGHKPYSKGHWLVDELQRQGMSAGYAGYFSAINGESIVAYEGPGVDPELDRRLGIIIENVRRLNEALNWELWTTGDRTRVQSAIYGLELLPPRS